jgi:hypothetical protein
MMNWKGSGRKQSWPNLKAIFWHSTGRTKKNHEKYIGIAGLWAEI